MSVIISGPQVRMLGLGTKVDKAAATLPASTVQTLFTVSGGRILLTSILGEVTTIIQTQTNNAKLQCVPTTGTTVDWCATADITALEVGAFLTVTPDLDATPFSVALQKQNAGATTISLGVGIIVPIGAIKLSCSATNTGATKWSMTYIAYDDGATVA